MVPSPPAMSSLHRVSFSKAHNWRATAGSWSQRSMAWTALSTLRADDKMATASLLPDFPFPATINIIWITWYQPVTKCDGTTYDYQWFPLGSPLRFSDAGDETLGPEAASGASPQRDTIGRDDEVAIGAKVTQIGQIELALFMYCPLAPAASQVKKVPFPCSTFLLTHMTYRIWR